MIARVGYLDLREYLKESISKEYVRSLFIAGSAKEELSAGTDIDVFVVAHENTLDDFLDELTKKMKLFVKNNPNFVYSYFRGPIKFEGKILIHFVIYTDASGPGRVQDFQNEPPQVFEGILKKYDIILGEDPINMKNEMDLSSKSHGKREEYMKRKSREFWENGTVTYSEWKKKKGNWIFEHTTIKLSPWQKAHLEKYHINYKP